MKKLTLTGNTAIWDALNVVATNNGIGRTEKMSEIPEDKKLVVSLLDGFDPRNPSTDNVSASASSYVFRHGRKRNFLLTYNGVCVGWATFHRAERNYEVAATITLSVVENVTAKSEAEAKSIVENAIRSSVEISNSTFGTSFEVEDFDADARLSE